MSFICFALSLNDEQHSLKLYKRLKIHDHIYYTIIILIALALGLRGNMDEYSRFWILIPTIDQFMTNFEFYSDEQRFQKKIVSANIVAYEKGVLFTIIISLIKTFNLSAQSIFIFFSSIPVIIHGYYFKKYTPYAFLALLFYVSHDITGKEWISLRQGFVSALILPMIYFVVNKKRLKFYLILLVGFFIQYIAALSLLIIFLNRRLKIKYILLFLAIAFIINFLDLPKIILFNENLFINFPDFVQNYLTSEIHGTPISIFHPKVLQQIFLILFLVHNSKILDKLCNELKYFNILFNTYLLGTILMIIFTSLNILAFRINGHFYVVESLLISYLIYYFRPKTIAILGIIFVSLSFAYINYVLYERVTPYDFLVNDIIIFDSGEVYDLKDYD